jgi:uncharacterized repeat protein (TIGR02543 family)
MKKKFKFLFILMFVVYSFTLAACDFNKIFSFLPWVTEEKVEYYIDFMVDDEYYDTIKIEEGSSFYLPEDPYKEGYEFIGWVYSNGEEFNIHDVIDGDMTLYAEFREKTSLVIIKSSSLCSRIYLGISGIYGKQWGRHIF